MNLPKFCELLVPSTLTSSSMSHAFCEKVFVNKSYDLRLNHENHKMANIKCFSMCFAKLIIYILANVSSYVYGILG